MDQNLDPVWQCYVATHPIQRGQVPELACKSAASTNSMRIDFLLRVTVEVDIVAGASGVQAMGHTARRTTVLPQSSPNEISTRENNTKANRRARAKQENEKTKKKNTTRKKEEQRTHQL